jgi:uncharacterized protein YybS (DUF2232 family)
MGLVEEAPDALIHMATSMLPGLVTTMVVFFAWVNTVIAVNVLKRNNLYAPDLGSLDQWKAPEQLVWVAILGTAGLLIDIRPLFLLSRNVMCLVMMVYFIQGISIVSFFINKTRIPPLLRYTLYWLVFFQFPINLLITGIGLFDMWVDFRKRLSKTSTDDTEE